MSNFISRTQRAIDTPFDPTGSSLVSIDTESAIKEINSTTEVTISPGFSWGASGNQPNGSYLLNETVPSNLAGRVVPLISGFITDIFVSCRVNATFTVTIQKRTGATFTNLASLSLTAQRVLTASITPVAISSGDELACVISSGSCSNPVVGIQLKGTT